jgi:hypothetical protein
MMHIENDQPQFHVVPEPVFHEECGHFHLRYADCPEPNSPCGSYLCCIPNEN